MNGLRKKRLENDKTQKEVSEHIGVSYQAYAHYENGRREPRYAVLKKLAEYFCCSIDDLF